jgi:glutathione S-transferase
MKMPIKLYELVGKDIKRPFSPHCWKTRLSLAHKGLEFEIAPVRFTEIPEIEDGQCKSVPVIRDGDRLVQDSFAIAEYLDETYGVGGGALFEGPDAVALTRFVESWSQTQLMPWIAKWALLDIHDMLDEADRAYFRRSRENRMGKSLEAVVADRDARLSDLDQVLAPLAMSLKRMPYLCGEALGFADFVAFGGFQWLRVVSGLHMMDKEGPVFEWIERMLDLQDGHARDVAEAQP